MRTTANCHVGRAFLDTPAQHADNDIRVGANSELTNVGSAAGVRGITRQPAGGSNPSGTRTSTITIKGYIVGVLLGPLAASQGRAVDRDVPRGRLYPPARRRDAG